MALLKSYLKIPENLRVRSHELVQDNPQQLTFTTSVSMNSTIFGTIKLLRECDIEMGIMRQQVRGDTLTFPTQFSVS